MNYGSFDLDYMLNQLDFDEESIATALAGLVSKGLIEEFTENGAVKYRLTSNGILVKNHLDSDPSSRN